MKMLILLGFVNSVVPQDIKEFKKQATEFTIPVDRFYMGQQRKSGDLAPFEICRIEYFGSSSFIYALGNCRDILK